MDCFEERKSRSGDIWESVAAPAFWVRCGEVWAEKGKIGLLGGYLDLFRKNDAEADCQTRHFYGMIDET